MGKETSIQSKHAPVAKNWFKLQQILEYCAVYYKVLNWLLEIDFLLCIHPERLLSAKNWVFTKEFLFNVDLSKFHCC